MTNRPTTSIPVRAANALPVAAALLLAVGAAAPGGAQSSDEPDSLAELELADSAELEQTADTAAAAGAAYRLPAVRVDGGQTPAIDGNVEDEAWRRAPVATDFVQWRPDEGAPASQPTEARVLYGPDALYVAFRAYDSAPDSIAGQLTRRDQESYSDRLHVAIDSYFDRRTAFHFAVNPVGVKWDVYRFEDTREDDSWDAVWEVATAVDDEGWTAEFRIPYSQLRFDDAEVQDWGINLGREIARYDEISTWAPQSQTQDAFVSLFGRLEGLRGLGSPTRLEVEPYTMARVRRAPGNPDNPFHESTALGGTVGADLEYGVTNNLTLNLTLNPDFGQVEADPARVNLTAFETFFPEKRPFFLEGRNIFEFGIGAGGGGQESLFYSRRIGRAPHGRADARGGFTDAPENTTILGAGKLSGKTAGGWSIGALNAVTGEEEARVFTGDGEHLVDPVEPLTSYSVGRLQKDFREGWSALGVIGTATNRENAVADELGLHRDAYTGGVDFRHRFGEDGDFRVRGNLLGSRVAGSEDAIARTQRSPARYFQRPDNDHAEFDPGRTALGGWSGTLEVGKFGGGFWRGALMTQVRSPGFEVNDLGFMRNADYYAAGGFVGYHRSEPGEHFRRWNLNLNAFSVQSFGHEPVERGGNVNGSFTLHNLWSGHAGVAHNVEAFSLTELRGGPALRTDAEWFGWGGLNTDSRKEVRLGTNVNWGVTPESDAWRLHLGTNARWRPSGRMNLRLGPFVRWNHDDQWIGRLEEGDAATHYLFGRLDQTTVGLTGRLEVAFTPTLSLQLYGQPFVSAGDYESFSRVADPGARAHEERFTDLDARPADGGWEADLDGDGTPETFPDPTFNVKQFRSNAVLRWQYRPGSTLYLVWSQARDHFGRSGDFRFGNDFDDLFGARPDDVLMLKVSYWFSP